MVERREYVEFFSPGTLVSESTTRPVCGRLVPLAVSMAGEIKERHGATPYGFRFLTMLEAPSIDDSEDGTLKVQPKRVDQSGMHYITGEVKRLCDIPDCDEMRILRGNMRGNKMPVIIENRNSWRFTGEFAEADCVVDWDGEVIRRGNDPDLLAYRQAFASEGGL